MALDVALPTPGSPILPDAIAMRPRPQRIIRFHSKQGSGKSVMESICYDKFSSFNGASSRLNLTGAN
jgi:hypothetical protein